MQISEIASLPLLQQVMGHAYASTFQKYMNQQVQSHVQAAFLGVPSEDALMNIFSHQSCYVDPRASSHFDDLIITEQSLFLTHPDIICLQELQDSLTAEAKELYRLSKNAAGTKLEKLKAKAEASLRCAKAKLKKATFNTARDQFFNTINTKEINKQLNLSFLDIDDKDYHPEIIVHKLEEQRLVADLMRTLIKDLSERETLQHQITLINALIDLGCLVKVLLEKTPRAIEMAATTPRLTSIELFQPDQDLSPTPEPRDSSISLTNKYCIFCVFNPHHQCYFSTSHKAQEHFEKHMWDFERDGPI